MFKGFYNLTSGMITQSRVLNTISNNIANASTPGYKKETMLTTTFQDVMMYRTGNSDKRGTASLNGTSSMLLTVDETVTDYSQGAYEETGRSLDFCLLSSGFFQIQTQNGTVYSRNGSFTLDDQGYLYLQHVGRVMGDNGPIYLGTDQIQSDSKGRIFDSNGAYLGQIAIVDFNDYTQLEKFGEGMFQGPAPDTVNAPESSLAWQTLEMSNISAAKEMTAMMSSQRALQSSAQILKLYDQLIGKAVTEIGRV